MPVLTKNSLRKFSFARFLFFNTLLIMNVYMTAFMIIYAGNMFNK